jgi:WD40 repeat protein
LQTLSGHTSWVESVAWSPDGKRLATGGYDATVQVYTMDIHDLMNLARQRITAHPSEEACRSTPSSGLPLRNAPKGISGPWGVSQYLYWPGSSSLLDRAQYSLSLIFAEGA